MPLEIKTMLKYKDPNTGRYKSMDLMGEALTFDAEAYAKGTRNGVVVGVSDPAYQNNAKYYSERSNTFRINGHKIIIGGGL